MSEITQRTRFAEQFIELQQRSDRMLMNFIAPLPLNNGNLVSAMRYSTLFGGKRLRPFLVYSTGQMFGVTQNNLDAPAAAVECIHAYSLIHDDLPAMDNEDLRRSHPTCHIKFGEANAILAGDALQTLAFSILSDADMPDVTLHDRLAMLSELAKASGVAGMCGGQSMDLEVEGKQIKLSTLEQIHQHKTGALIRAAMRLGALAAGSSAKSALPLLDRYANAIGLAFQVQDDILDVIGKKEKIGKHQGADQKHRKNTYPALLGLNSAKVKASELYQTALSTLKILSEQSYDTELLLALADFIIKRDN